jgi:hypothetical protein
MSAPGELVFCHSGDKYAERPLALVWQEKRLAVSQVLKSWRTPEAQAFRVVTQDQQVFDLFYDLDLDSWSIYLR